MNDREAFIRQIRESPDDEFPRLVYADYLEEMGDFRGELIRLQCKLPTLDVMDAQWRTTRERIKELLTDHSERWLAPLRAAGAAGVTLRSFERGLIERVVVKQSGATEALEQLCELEPALQYVELKVEAHEELAKLRLPAQVKTLDISHNSFQDVSEECFTSWEGASSIVGLVARNCRLIDKQVNALLSNSFSQLTTLALDGNRFGSDALESIAGADWFFPRLKRLSLSTNGIGMQAPQQPIPRGVMTALGEHGRQLESLSLATCSFRDDSIHELLQTAGLHEVRSLDLRANALTLEAISAFIEQKSMPVLSQLDLRANNPHSNTGRYGYGVGVQEKLVPVAAKLRERYGDGVRV